MSNERVQELISATADRELDPEERVELDQLLQDSPEARQFQSDLAEIDTLLRELPVLEPPRSLRTQITDRLESVPQSSSRSILTWLWQPNFGAVLRYGAAATFGLLLGVAVYEGQLLDTTTTDITDLVGTMTSDSLRPPTDIIDSYSIRSRGFESLARIAHRDDILLLHVQINAEDSVELVVNFAPAGLRLDAISQSRDALESIEYVGDTLRVQASGHNRFSVLLRRDDDATLTDEAKIEFNFSVDGRFLQRQALHTTW